MVIPLCVLDYHLILSLYEMLKFFLRYLWQSDSELTLTTAESRTFQLKYQTSKNDTLKMSDTSKLSNI